MTDCTFCRVTADDYTKRSQTWECSHVACPLRRGITAAAPDHLIDQSFRGGTVPIGSGADVGHAGCYRVTPTTRD